MKTTIVTTTRDRAFCFGLCERWMERQNFKWDQWLVINDGREEYSYTMGQQVVSRDPSNDTLPSICENWLAALPLVEGNRVFVVEDDDYYDPRHLETLNGMLDEADLAGISHDVYFKLPSRRFVRMHNADHASLAATAFRAELLPRIERMCRVFKSVFIDCYLWVEAGNIWPATKRLSPQPMPDGRMLHVGMKNMPGASGLGIGHKNPHDGSTDPSFAVFAEWVGGEATQVYRRVWADHFNKA